jgi:hypothetical protein
MRLDGWVRVWLGIAFWNKNQLALALSLRYDSMRHQHITHGKQNNITDRELAGAKLDLEPSSGADQRAHAGATGATRPDPRADAPQPIILKNRMAGQAQPLLFKLNRGASPASR